MGYDTLMSEYKRRFLESTWNASATTTFIGFGSVIVGDVQGTGQFIVSGEVNGDGHLDGALTLSITGSWHGDLRAAQAQIAGKVIGALEVEGNLEIGSSAVIRGKVTARTMAIAKGAIVDGEITITSGAPIVQFEEKREPN
jgi:cytoskeletal protein CcmA (bactofilin family)